jgi:hypothetical protein
LVVGTVEREREGEKKLQKRGKKAVFLRLWTQFSPRSDHQQSLYL